ncbi:MAG: lamin tail domain-containing protein, partial [Bacteroidales bacterium]|nr:lamin tail domain-containing protein [Bacteroidales bacterium]
MRFQIFGNGDIDLTGYKFCYIVGTLGGTDTLVTNINKTYTFPNGYILPSNKSICLVARNAAGFTGSDSVALPITAG